MKSCCLRVALHPTAISILGMEETRRGKTDADRQNRAVCSNCEPASNTNSKTGTSVPSEPSEKEPCDISALGFWPSHQHWLCWDRGPEVSFCPVSCLSLLGAGIGGTATTPSSFLSGVFLRTVITALADTMPITSV